MRPPESEIALRRIVSDLADLDPRDVGAILDMLDPAHRRQVEMLLAQYTVVRTGRPASGPERVDLGLLSPWLAERVRTADGMTVRLAELLRDSAETTLPERPIVEEARPALLSQLLNLLPGRKVEA